MQEWHHKKQHEILAEVYSSFDWFCIIEFALHMRFLHRPLMCPESFELAMRLFDPSEDRFAPVMKAISLLAELSHIYNLYNIATFEQFWNTFWQSHPLSPQAKKWIHRIQAHPVFKYTETEVITLDLDTVDDLLTCEIEISFIADIFHRSWFEDWIFDEFNVPRVIPFRFKGSILQYYAHIPHFDR